jgi:hypothetical protein
MGSVLLWAFENLVAVEYRSSAKIRDSSSYLGLCRIGWYKEMRIFRIAEPKGEIS